jgi:hypothetical protein
MNAAYGALGTYGFQAAVPLGSYGKASAQERCAGAIAAKKAGQSRYRWRGVDVQIAQWCKGAEAEVEALQTAKRTAGMDPKSLQAAERASRPGIDPVLLFGGLAALGLGLAAYIVVNRGKKKGAE